MRRFTIRWGLFAAAVLTFSVGTVAVFPTPSYAAVSITSMGGPINVLPSAVQSAAGAAPTAGLSQADMMAIYMYRASKSPEFWALYAQAQKTAQTTGKPLALTADVAAEAKTVYPAASKVAPFVKTAGKAVGTAGAVLTAYQMAGQLTNGALDLAGLDATGTVCSGTGRDLWGLIVQTAASVTCADYDKASREFTPNTDATGGYTMSPITSPDGSFRVSGLAGTAVSGRSTSFCFSASGRWSNDSGSKLTLIYRTAAGGTEYTPIDPDYSSPAYCPTGYIGSYSIAGTYDKDASTQASVAAASRPMCVAPNWNGGSTDPSQQYAYTPTTCLKGSSSFEQGDANPTRTLRCVVAGTDGLVYDKSTDTFTETTSTVLPKVTCPDLPPGVGMGDVKIEETGADGGPQTIWQATPDQNVQKALTNYGQCGTTSLCPLVLFKDGKSCFDAADCTGWYKATDKDPYTCKYGSYSVSLSECTVYANRWEPSAQTSGNNLSNPTTGEPLKNPKPELSPGSDASAGSTSADGATNLGPNNCFKGMPISLNPISWVVEPFKCMFIPRDGYTDQILGTYKKKADNTFPAKLAGEISGLTFKGPGSGCSGIPVHIGQAIPDFTIMAACKGDMLAPAAMWGRIFLDLGISVVGLLAITKFVGSAFGFTALGSKGDDE